MWGLTAKKLQAGVSKKNRSADIAAGSDSESKLIRRDCAALDFKITIESSLNKYRLLSSPVLQQYSTCECRSTSLNHYFRVAFCNGEYVSI
jgi:hypothetical protein